MTAGIAAPAYAGIPVTHRDAASAVTFVTGHEDPEKPESALDWDALAGFPGTLVLYMGVKNLPLISERLIAAGRPAGEPAAVIERGTHPGQRAVVATLEEIPARASEESIRPPSITVIGPVVALRETLAWLERRPLHGQVVAVTVHVPRPAGWPHGCAISAPRWWRRPRSAFGRSPLEGDLLESVSGLRDYALVCLTSPNGARLLFDALEQTNQDARALAGATVAAIGPGTAAELAARGIRADVVPERFVAEGLIDALAPLPLDGQRVLVARAAEARDALPAALRERGAEVTRSRSTRPFPRRSAMTDARRSPAPPT